MPVPGELDEADCELLAKAEGGFETAGALYAACKFRAALGEAMGLAREANGYTFAALSAGLDRKAPWFQIKEDPQAAATSVYVTQSVWVVDSLKAILAPTLCVPHTAQKLHEYLGYDGQLFGMQKVVEYQAESRYHRTLTYDHSEAIGIWKKHEPPPGQALRAPAPLFKKLDESVIEEEYVRLGG